MRAKKKKHVFFSTPSKLHGQQPKAKLLQELSRSVFFIHGDNIEYSTKRLKTHCGWQVTKVSD